MIRKKDGIHVNQDVKHVLDSRNSIGDTNFVSHAHSDHAFKKNGEIICSKLTEKLLQKRFNADVKRVEHDSIKLIDSGHILGSSAALIDNKVLYTGDVSTRDRAYIQGFRPVEAKELIIEATYGIPAYRFPDQEEIERSIQDWVEENSNPLFLFAYALGKAQKIQYLVQEVTERPIVAHGSVLKMNNVLEKHTDLEFNALPYKENKDLLKEDGIYIGPTSTSKKQYINKLVSQNNGLKAGFSGWALHNSMGYSRYDKAFPFSDHCDFNELVELVEQVEPEKVYTHHGFDEQFASYLRKEKGFNARALKNNQSSLTDF